MTHATKNEAASPMLDSDGKLCVDMAQVMLPVSFTDCDEGALAAIEASKPALALLTELQMALAGRAIAGFLNENPGIVSFGSDLDQGNDEGGYELQRAARTIFADHSEMPSCDYRDDEDAYESAHDDFIAELGGSRQALHEKAARFFDALVAAYPLTRSRLEGSMHSQSAAAAMSSPEFKARRDAFEIEQATHLANDAALDIRRL